MKFMYQQGILSLTSLLAISSLLIFLTDRYILTASFYESNGALLSGLPGSGGAIYDSMQKWVYFSSAAYLLIKLAIISLILHTALFLRDHETAFGKIFRVVTLAEFIFLLPATVKLVSFNYTFDRGTLLDWHRYYVLSALWLFEDVPADWYYALQTLNLFEVAYWFILAYGIAKATGKAFDDALSTVVYSYVPALTIWVASVTFFTLLMFPATS